MIEYRDVVGFICKLSTGFFNSMLTFLFLDVSLLKLRITIIILLTNQPDIVLPTAYTTKN